MGLFGFITKGNKNQSEATRETRTQSAISDYSNSGSINRYSPRSFDDVAKIIDVLTSGNPTIVDVSAVSSSTAQRVIDLLSGAIYAIDGNMGELTKDVYVFTPRGAKF